VVSPAIPLSNKITFGVLESEAKKDEKSWIMLSTLILHISGQEAGEFDIIHEGISIEDCRIGLEEI